MKLSQLVADLRTMTEDELREHVRAIRHSKYVERPAQAARKEKKERKTGNKAVGQLEKLLASLPEAERLAIIKQLSKG